MIFMKNSHSREGMKNLYLLQSHDKYLKYDKD